MIKFIKKHKLKFISSFLCAFAMALFTFISFSCKTYAYTIDNNGNLVGDNLFNNYEPYSTSGNVTYTYNNIECRVSASSSASGSTFITYYFNDIEIGTTYYFKIWEYNYLPSGIWYSNTTGGSWNPNVSSVVIVATQNFLTINIDIQKNVDNIFKYISLSTTELVEWEPYGVWYSSSNYDTLENQLNNTSGLLDLQIDITKYGWLSYIDNLDYYVTGNFIEDYSLSELKSNNYISNNATLDLYQLSLIQNPNYSYIRFDIYFQNSYANTDYFSANLFDISTKLGFNGVLTIVDTDNNSAIFNITDIVSVTYEDIISKNSNFGDYIYSVSFEFASPDASTMIYTNSFYSRGYQTGYSYGSNVSNSYYTPIINDLNSRISDLENNIDNLNNTIDTLKELNSQYQEQLANNVGWSSLFFAFADTPFKVVSNVLGFELFGLNLFSTFIGMVTVFGVVYLLKKFL